MKSIPNFVGNSPLEITTVNGFVTLMQYSGSLSLSHSMRTDQARELAALLIAEADAADAKALEEAA